MYVEEGEMKLEVKNSRADGSKRIFWTMIVEYWPSVHVNKSRLHQVGLGIDPRSEDNQKNVSNSKNRCTSSFWPQLIITGTGFD